MILDHGRELLRGLGEQAAAELGVGQAEPKLRQEVVSRKKAFDPMFLVARVVNDERCGRPLRVESRAQVLELLRLLLRMDAYRYEVCRDEIRNSGVGVNLGIQPSTPCSKWSGAEVEQDVHVSTPCLLQRLVQIVKPRNRCACVGHESLRDKENLSCKPRAR